MTNNNVNDNMSEVIDIRIILKKILAKKKLFFKALPIAFVMSSVLIVCVPRYYTSSLSLAPEVANSGMEGTLGSIASSFGFDISSMQTQRCHLSPALSRLDGRQRIRSRTV